MCSGSYGEHLRAGKRAKRSSRWMSGEVAPRVHELAGAFLYTY